LINSKIIGDATALLVRIRHQCCDGKINIDMDNGYVDSLVRFLEGKGLVNNRRLYEDNRHYIGVTSKGKLILQGLGVN